MSHTLGRRWYVPAASAHQLAQEPFSPRQRAQASFEGAWGGNFRGAGGTGVP